MQEPIILSTTYPKHVLPFKSIVIRQIEITSHIGKPYSEWKDVMCGLSFLVTARDTNNRRGFKIVLAKYIDGNCIIPKIDVDILFRERSFRPSSKMLKNFSPESLEIALGEKAIQLGNITMKICYEYLSKMGAK